MLHQLQEYARTEVPFSEPGFTDRSIRWRIEISGNGRLLGVIPQGDKDKGQEKWGCPEMHNMNSGGRAHFLIDNLQTAILFLGKKNAPAAAQEEIGPRHEFFVSRIREAAETAPILKPLAEFLADSGQIKALRTILANPPHQAKPTDSLEWRIAGKDPLQDKGVLDWWRGWRLADLGGTLTEDEDHDKSLSMVPPTKSDMVCFMTGWVVAPLLTHSKISGLAGGQPSGDVLVGFDKPAFTSFYLKKSANAAMSEAGARNYVDALNHLIRHRSRPLAGTKVLHWFKGTVPYEDDVIAWLQDPPEVAAASAASKAKELLDSIQQGTRPDLGNSFYYALTVSGMSGRVMVRDWMEGRFEELATNIGHWFSDLEITTLSGKKCASDPKLETVVTCALAERKPSQKYEDWIKPIGSARRQLLLAAIQNQPIPFHVVTRIVALLPAFLISEGVTRVLFPRREQPGNDASGLIISRLYARMGLLRAYFIRKLQGGDSTMTAYLNPEHPEPAYQCGRLLAVLANLQKAALGDVGAGVVQRYYTAFSQTPGLRLGPLVANARNHLGKLEAGLAWWYEEHIAEIMSRLRDHAPRILDLEGQGLFALGYYQQLAALRARNKTAEFNETDSKGETR